jgi:hypothetical protein
MTDALIAQSKAVGEAIAGQNERIAAQERAIADRIAAQNESLNAILSGQTERVTKSLDDQAKRTAETAAAIQERLAVIDAARSNIEGLGQQVGSLAAILSNKQSRGTFGEAQLKQIVEDRLPPDAFAFQQVFSTRARADCLIRLPYPPGPVAVDSKFPLESRRPSASPRTCAGTWKTSGRNTSSPARPRTGRCCSCRRRRSSLTSIPASPQSSRKRPADASISSPRQRSGPFSGRCAR